MTVTSGISFLGQSSTQSQRLQTQQRLLAELQRQITTQKKHEQYSGYGSESLSLQRYRMDLGRTDSYLQNITTVTTRVNMMNDAMDRALKVGRDLIESIATEVREGELDMTTISLRAQESLNFMRDLINTKIDDRYLFAGSASTTVPFANPGILDNNFQTEIANWLNGTNTTGQLISNTEAFGVAALGFDPALSAAGSVSIRVDDTAEIDYTVIGSSNGFNDIIRALSFAANLTFPNPATDTPTASEFHDVLDQVLEVAQRGVRSLETASAALGSKFKLITSIEEVHTQDKATLQNLIGKIEDVDTTEALVKVQALQTQITASYQVTSIVSQLSLINFL